MDGIHVILIVEYLRHGDEHSVLLILLPNVGEAAEDEHAHDDHQHQQTQLLVAAGDTF